LLQSCLQDIETINTAAQRKQGDVAKTAYEKAAADLSAFKSAI
jgi:predicted solute-binding protein